MTREPKANASFIAIRPEERFAEETQSILRPNPLDNKRVESHRKNGTLGVVRIVATPKGVYLYKIVDDKKVYVKLESLTKKEMQMSQKQLAEKRANGKGLSSYYDKSTQARVQERSLKEIAEEIRKRNPTETPKTKKGSHSKKTKAISQHYHG